MRKRNILDYWGIPIGLLRGKHRTLYTGIRQFDRQLIFPISTKDSDLDIEYLEVPPI